MGSFMKANLLPGLKADADYSAETNRYKAVKLDADGKVTLAGANSPDFIGFLQNTPNSQGAAEIAVIGGGSKAIAGGTIEEGDRLTTDTNGDLVSIATGETKYACAIALQGAVDNDIFSVLVLAGTTHTEP